MAHAAAATFALHITYQDQLQLVSTDKDSSVIDNLGIQ